MEFQQLEMFAAVVEEGSVTGAADRVCRTAPAVSIALRKLEEELGTPLFDRSELRNFQLTDAGKVFYSHSRRILEMRNAATTSIKDLVLGRRGTLRLGTHESVSLYLLPNLIRAFGDVHPGIKTEVVCGSGTNLLTALRTGTIDLALIGDAPDEPSLERHVIKQDELVLIVSPKHRLSSLTQVHLRNLAGEFLIVEGTKSVLRERIVRALEEAGIPFNLSVENVAIEAIKRMVIDGLGIGFVPSMCVSDETASGKLVALKVGGLRTEWDLSLVHRKDHPLSPAARSFVNVSLTGGESFPTPTEPARESNQTQIETRGKRRQAFAIQPRKVVHC